MADPNMDGNPENSVEQQVYNQQQAEQQQQASFGKDEATEYSQLSNLIVDLDRRLRVLEERYSNLRKKLQLTDQNLLDSERSFSKELKTINDDSLELKRSMNDFADKIMIFSGEMDSVAKKSDVKVIEKYLNMWSPATFVTRNELKDYLRSKSMKTASEKNDDDSDLGSNKNDR